MSVAYRIVNNISGKVIMLEPKVVESCMTPGTFRITPVEKKETEDSINFKTEDKAISIGKECLKLGDIVIEELEFVPQQVRRKGNCRPCTNCGRC